MCPPYYGAFWLLAEARCGQQAAGDALFKRLAARESPKAMEPPTVSRFLYRSGL
jgi:hypothetical protein